MELSKNAVDLLAFFHRYLILYVHNNNIMTTDEYFKEQIPLFNYHPGMDKVKSELYRNGLIDYRETPNSCGCPYYHIIPKGWTVKCGGKKCFNCVQIKE